MKHHLELRCANCLNLLVVFAAMMQHRSVTRAAEALNLSQPAMSAALARLRAWMTENALVAQAEPIFGYFDPPWTLPVFRRNEVMIRLAP